MPITSNKSWWQRELPEVERHLRDWLGRHLPARRIEHDDLVADTLLAVSGWMGSHETPGSPPDRDGLQRLAYTILKRRVADLFRLDQRKFVAAQALASVDATAESPERRLQFRRLLDAAILALSELDEDDRHIISALVSRAPGCSTLTATERKRLSRARARFVKRVSEILGLPVDELFEYEQP